MLYDWEIKAHTYQENRDLFDCPVIDISVWDIINRPDGERTRIDTLKGLMRKNGQECPIKVFRLWGRYKILEGRHRLIAARELEWKTIKAQDVTDYKL